MHWHFINQSIDRSINQSILNHLKQSVQIPLRCCCPLAAAFWAPVADMDRKVAATDRTDRWTNEHPTAYYAGQGAQRYLTKNDNAPSRRKLLKPLP